MRLTHSQANPSQPAAAGEPGNNVPVRRQAVFRAQRMPAPSTPQYQPARAPETRVAERRTPAPEPRSSKKRVLHVGCGTKSSARLHAVFRQPQWQEVRLDIDASAEPDIAGSLTDMNRWIEDQSYDAIWASHVIEHLLRHEVAKALSEFHRALVPTGYALIRTPDIEAVAQFILDGRIDDVIYRSPAGPITPLDMMYGHGASVERGKHAMRHGTAFTQDLLASDLLQAGFSELRVTRSDTHEIWALAFMPEAEIAGILDDLAAFGLDLRS
jgi:SAM-dependent methyltransferase